MQYFHHILTCFNASRRTQGAARSRKCAEGPLPSQMSKATTYGQFYSSRCQCSRHQTSDMDTMHSVGPVQRHLFLGFSRLVKLHNQGFFDSVRLVIHKPFPPMAGKTRRFPGLGRPPHFGTNEAHMSDGGRGSLPANMLNHC